MPDRAAQFLKRVVPVARVRADVQDERKIAQRPAAEQPPQVDRDRDLRDALPLPRETGVLHGDDAFHHDCRDEGGHCHFVAVRRIQQVLRGDDARGERPESSALRRAAQAEGLFLPAGRGDLRRIFQEAVFQFFRGRRLIQVQKQTFPRDLDPVFQLQIMRRQIAEKHAAAVPVRHRVEALHGDAVVVIEDAEAVPAQLAPAHERERVGVVLLHLQAAAALLQVIPEEALPERHEKGRKPPPHVIHGALQDFRVDRVPERRGDAELIAPVPSRDRGENQCRRVQAIPFLLHELSVLCVDDGGMCGYSCF